MNKHIKGWMVGGLLAVSALGLVFGTTSLGSAAARNEDSSPGKIQNEHMTQMGPEMMKNSPNMQKQCEAKMKDADLKKSEAAGQSGEAVANPDGTNSPETRQQCQTTMKETGATIDEKAPTDDSTASGGVDHNAHHSS